MRKQVKMQQRVQNKKKKFNSALFLPLYLILHLMVLYSCNNDRESYNQNKESVIKDTLSAMNDVLEDEYDDLKLLYKTGDTNLYRDIKIQFLDYPSEKLLFPALYMANIYNYKPAYYDVYFTIKSAYNQEEPLSKKEIGLGNYDLAIKHLILGAKIGDEMCLRTIKGFYPELIGEINK